MTVIIAITHSCEHGQQELQSIEVVVAFIFLKFSKIFDCIRIVNPRLWSVNT
jgi:hypothetical protein